MLNGGRGGPKKDLAKSPGKAGAAAQDFRVVFNGKNIQVRVDGNCAIDFNDPQAGDPAPATLSLYASKRGRTVFRNLRYKDLTLAP